jgi:acylphosphatase
VRGVIFEVRGHVQGVGFRWWVRSRAGELGLIGSVRNRPDGAVEVRAAGPPEALEAIRVALHRGPPSAVVTAVTESAAELDDNSTDFTILLPG